MSYMTSFSTVSVSKTKKKKTGRIYCLLKLRRASLIRYRFSGKKKQKKKQRFALCRALEVVELRNW